MSEKPTLGRLTGQVAVVTGASSGLGRASARALAAEGARLLVTARRQERLEELRAQLVPIGSECEILPGDVREESTAVAAVDAALKRFGRIDLLVHCAGQGIYKKLVDTSAEEYDRLMDVNMRSSFLFARAVVPHMIQQRSGTIVLVSSIAGLSGPPNEAVYAATKFAQVGFAESLAEELRGYGIKVCSICPGGMKTDFALGHGRSAESVASSTMMRPEDVADAIVFTCLQPANTRIVKMTVRHMGTPFV